MSSVPAVLLHATPLFCPLPANYSDVLAECGVYRARLAANAQDREAVYRLRFLVFNLELHEGLESAYLDGLDTDCFDEPCDHLMVEHVPTGTVVGTYRMQSGFTAAGNFGYYSEQEFDFAPFEAMRGSIIELGRACIHRNHRTSQVLNLLWKGLVRYSRQRGGRYMMGCCSMNSQSAAEGRAVYEHLAAYMVEPDLLTVPRVACMLPAYRGEVPEIEPPRLLRAYLALGARICAEPALDASFGTIDFLTLMDLEMLHPRVRRRFA